uniref:RING-type domain-containing protein n=1 Tax=Sphaeramia orbicularis TaxID=375764 RepID=A0A672ZUQ6_9TELE
MLVESENFVVKWRNVCLDLFKDPVTIPCGHSYCMSCIKGFWEHEDQKTTHSCPQCRHSVTPRPALVKNTILAEIVEDLKRVGPEAASPDLCYAEPKDVACDFCTGRKLKAFKSCLMCMASYCEEHLQPHYDVAPLRKHKLLDATLNLQGTICSRHDEVMKIFCRTDHQCICYLSAELAERQTELSSGRQKLQLSIQEREERVKAIQQEVEAINHSADDAVRESEKIFSNLIRFIKKKSTDAKQQIRSQQKTQVSRAKEHQDKIQELLEKYDIRLFSVNTRGLMYEAWVHTKTWRTPFSTLTFRCIKSEVTVEMCAPSRQLHSWRTHVSSALEPLATLRGDTEKLLIM